MKRSRAFPHIAFLAAACLVAYLSLCPQLRAQVSVTTWHNDNWRTGRNVNETALTTTNVNTTSFGLVCKFQLSTLTGYSGKWSHQVYAQPLVVSNSDGSMTVYVVTHDDVVIAFTIPSTWNGQSCTGISYTVRDLLAGTSPQQYPADCCYLGGKASGCPTINPTVGVLGTPVIDTTNNTLYLVAESQSGQPNTYNPGPQGGVCPTDNSPTAWYHYMHALDPTTLQEKTGYGSPVQVYPPGNTNPSLWSENHIQRPGLLHLPGPETPYTKTTYAAFSMMDGAGFPYPDGWVFGYNATNLGRTPNTFGTTPGTGTNGGGIWQDGVGLAAGISQQNGSTYLFFTTGNHRNSNVRNILPVTTLRTIDLAGPKNSSRLFSRFCVETRVFFDEKAAPRLVHSQDATRATTIPPSHHPDSSAAACLPENSWDPGAHRSSETSAAPGRN
jgi:hypothetical protein